MTEGLIQGNVRQEWRLVRVADVIVRERQRAVDAEHVKKIRSSFQALGGQLQLQPIVLDGDLVLIDGAHRHQAAADESWEFISALVCHGVTDQDRPLLEAEANRVRKQLSPVELAEAWRTYYEPAFRARAKQNSAANLRHGNESPGPGNTRAGETAAPVSIATAAKETTGMGIDWLNKMQDIDELSRSSTAPEPLRAAAKRGLEKLSKPGAKVDPIYKELLALQDAHARREENPEERQARELERTLDRALSDTSLLAERLRGGLGQDLTAAAKVAPAGHESLRAVRVSVTHALAELVALQCQLEPNPVAALEVIGREVTRTLSQLTISRLGLEAAP